jgi:hypothetical protein
LTENEEEAGDKLRRWSRKKKAPPSNDREPKLHAVAQQAIRRKAAQTRFILSKSSPAIANSLRAGSRSRFNPTSVGSSSNLTASDMNMDDGDCSTGGKSIDAHFDSVESLADKFTFKQFLFTWALELVPIILNSVFVLIKYGPTQKFINVAGHRQLLPVKSLSSPDSTITKYLRGQLMGISISWFQFVWIFLFLYYNNTMVAEGITMHQVMAVSCQNFIRTLVIATKYA